MAFFRLRFYTDLSLYSLLKKFLFPHDKYFTVQSHTMNSNFNQTNFFIPIFSSVVILKLDTFLFLFHIRLDSI